MAKVSLGNGNVSALLRYYGVHHCVRSSPSTKGCSVAHAYAL